MKNVIEIIDQLSEELKKLMTLPYGRQPSKEEQLEFLAPLIEVIIEQVKIVNEASRAGKGE